MTNPNSFPTEGQLDQYSTLQDACDINGIQAGFVIEQAYLIDDALDTMACYPDADPAMLKQEIADAEKFIDQFLGSAAARNLAQKPLAPESEG